MAKKIGCLHMHHSNIAVIEQALDPEGMELTHYVDPGLMSRLTSDPGFDMAQARQKVREQLTWIAQTQVDAILITCTNYIAVLGEESLPISVPTIKIDEPFFAAVCAVMEPQILLFTNPATVEGTMNRLKAFAAAAKLSTERIEARVLPDTFELVMQGRTAEYTREVTQRIKELAASERDKRISVAQLSMAEAAEQVERDCKIMIGNPLRSLNEHVHQVLRGEG